ncbi:MAG TPA: L-threonylcarbamoyladenylate synthase [Bacteroidales bacterium]|nr:L-threonylcarbamoyladenylate synthase [Bacteroidales bacterium]HQG55539.1 L-threonylcarbamoyladenylate synthase [Bacteroidales bacterium]HQK70817.1 L-threonylcarbamoyladenylate synthase [Bacteroidales bacterium]HRT47361.1 L-threonylcarbamoyladenylate synthase [Bacteroidales bacterium]
MKKDLDISLDVLRKGGVILYPTDTVWGLGCDATFAEAVEKIFAIKQRRDSKSLIILVNSHEMLEEYVQEIPPMAEEITKIADKPITIVYPRSRNLAPGVSAEDGSVGIRITKDKFCSALIEKLGKPLVSTSANRSGEPAPGNFSEIPEEIIKAADYTVTIRREEKRKAKPSPVIRVEMNGEIKILRR